MVLGSIAGALASVSLAAEGAKGTGGVLSTVVIGIVLVIAVVAGGAGLVMALWGGLQNLVLAFRTSILWGLAVLFIPGAALLFLLLYWQDTKKWFLLGLKGYALIVAAGLVSAATIALIQPDEKHTDSREEASTAASASTDDDSLLAGERDEPRSDVRRSEPEKGVDPEPLLAKKADGSPLSVTELMPVASKLAQEWKPGSVLVRLEATKMRSGLVDTPNGGRVTLAFRALSRSFADPSSTLEVVYDQSGLKKSTGAGLSSDEPLSWTTGCSAEEAIRASGSPNGETKGLFFIMARGSGTPIWLVVRPDGSDARIQASSCAATR
jgi:hypothetical protein